MANDIERRRQQIAAAEQVVELHRANFSVQNAARRERWQAWKVPLIVGGGALLGLLVGRRRSRPPSARHAPPAAPAAQTAKSAGKAAGLMAGLSLAARVVPVLLPLAQRYVTTRRPEHAQATYGSANDGSDWWSVARSVAPLFRR